MRSITLLYSLAALALTLPPLTNSDKTPYTAPLPPDKSFTVTFSDPSTSALDDGTPSNNVTISFLNIDMSKFSLSTSYVIPIMSNDPTQINDLCEVFTNQLLASTQLLPAITFPSSSPFLDQNGFCAKYNISLSTTPPTPPGGGGAQD